MNILKKINKFCGIIALLAFAVTAFDLINIVRNEPNNMLYYVSGTVFLLFGALFLLTAAIFILRDFFWHIRHKQFGLFIRHYLYTVVAVYIICILADYVFNYSVDWLGYLGYSLCIAIVQIYISGYKLNTIQNSAD